MDGTDGGSEPWLLELRAGGQSRFDLEVDVGLVSTLWDLGTTGVTEIDGRLVAGFADRGQAQAASRALRSLVAGVRAGPVGGIQIRPAASGHEVAEPEPPPSLVQFTIGDTVQSISVVAGTTFGHGHHPTTELALRLLGSALHRASTGRRLADLRVLDVGTGSGVLAVAAARAGAGSVVAVDVDASCRPVVAANAENNGVEIDIVIGAMPASLDVPLDPLFGAPFDVIVANLLLVEHIDVADTARSLLAPGGHLALSGCLVDQADRLLRLYPGLSTGRPLSDGDWIGYLLTSGCRRSHPQPPNHDHDPGAPAADPRTGG